MKKNNTACCPVCKQAIEIDDFIENDEIIFCPRCNETLRVVSTRPARLKEVGSNKKKKPGHSTGIKIQEGEYED